jgi:hypothetical protein
MTGSSRRDPRWDARGAQSWPWARQAGSPHPGAQPSWAQPSWAQPSWAQDPWQQHLRIGDAERDRAAAELGEHYAQGRLTTQEHSERLDLIWAAKTPADLAPVFADLPRPGMRPPTAGPHLPPRRPRRRGIPAPLMVLFVVLLVITVLTNLPLILIAVAAWFLLTRTGGCGSSRRQHWRH